MTARPGGGYRPVELAAGATGLLVPVLFATSFTLVAWAPRYAVLPVVAGAGLVVVRRLVAGPRRVPALLAVGFAGWAGLATVAAPTLTVAFWGRYAVGTGWVFVLALVGGWALGSSVRASAAGLVEQALMTACLLNTAVALAQQVVRLDRFGLALYGGRSAGLYGNPVYLAELLAGGLWLALSRLPSPASGERTRPASMAVVAVIAAGVAVAGSRFGLALAVVALAAGIPRLGWRRAGLAAVLVAAGLGLGTGLSRAGISGGGTTSVERVEAAPASGVRPRLDTWRSALPAIGHRPLTGWGPSGLLAATSPRRTLAVARAEGPDTLFADAHDWVVEYAVTTGLPGLGLLVAWLATAFAAARRRGPAAAPLAGFAAFTLGLMLLEPLHVGTTPVAFLALGAAGAVGAESEAAAAGGARERRARLRSRLATAVGAGVVTAGVVTGGVVATGLLRLRQADLNADPGGAVRAANQLPAWSAPATVVARKYGFLNVDGRDPSAGRTATRWLTAAARRDPDDPGPWIDLGGALAADHDLVGAEAAYNHALARNPWSARALRALARLEEELGRPARADELTARYRLVVPGG